jgi:hypothetical protein
MDWSSINWTWIGLVAVLAILVGGFCGGATYLIVRHLEGRPSRTQRRWDRELNGDYAPTDIVDIPRQREGEDS